MERLQKVLARAGLASRRNAESLILAGRVRVDGKVVTELGSRVSTRARVEVDGKLVEPERAIYIVLNKPRGTVCTMQDPEGRPTVADLIKGVDARVVPVGRLDFHTSGALLLTNDGDFASGLTHPSKKAEKVYVAKVQGLVDEDGLQRWMERILIDGVRTQPAEVRKLRFESGKTWLEITLREGKNRQIHRLGEHAGYPVMRLSRLSFADINTEGLRAGDWRYLGADELKRLKATFGVPKRIFAPPVPGERRPRRAVAARPEVTTRPKRASGTKRAPQEAAAGDGPRRGRPVRGAVEREPAKARPASPRAAGARPTASRSSKRSERTGKTPRS